jgi:hypothetical protein
VSVGVYVADILFPPEKWSPCKADMTQSLGPGDQHIPGKASKTIIPNHLAKCTTLLFSTEVFKCIARSYCSEFILREKNSGNCPSGGMPYQLIFALMPKKPSRSFLCAYFLIALTVLLLTTFADMLTTLQ